MADPVNEIVADQPSMPSQEDPANYQWWADWHEQKANEIAEQPSGPTQEIRLGQLQGEMDHRAAAAEFRESAEQHKSKSYATQLRRHMQEQGLLQDDQSPSEKPSVQDVLTDTRDAFRDYGIPEELAEEAVLVGKLDQMTDAAERERFYSGIVSAKDDLDDVVNRGGEGKTIEGVNDWRSAIEAAANRTESAPSLTPEDSKFVERVIESVREEMRREPKAPAKALDSVPSKDVSAGLQIAKELWRMSNDQLRSEYPLASEKDLAKIHRAGAIRAWLVSQVPANVQQRLGLNEEQSYRNGAERAYQKQVDKYSDALLKERAKVLRTLRGVDPNVQPHLLPSKQYRAAEKLTQIDQNLRRLRPISHEQYGAAVNAAGAKPMQQVAAKAPEKQQETDKQTAAALSVSASKHEAALASVRDIRGQVPVDGYRSKATEAMANRIIQQLQEGRETVQLSTRYAGGDQGVANATHRNAVETNAELIEAVRSHGIPVDTGTAMVALGKKSEVELAPQAEVDHSIESLP